MTRRTAHTTCLLRLVAPSVALVAVLASASPAAASTAPEEDPPARLLATSEKEASGAVAGVPAEIDDTAQGTSPALSLLPSDDGVLAAGGTLTASAVVDNAAVDELAAGTLELAIGADALADDDALTSWLEGGADAALTTLQSAPVEAVGGGAVHEQTLSVAASVEGLDGVTTGVHPLVATYTSGATVLEARSVVVVSDRRAPVGIVVPVTAPPSAAGVLDADALARLTGPGGALAQTLEAVTGTGAVLAVDPAIPAAIRALGSSAPAPAVEWLATLESLPNERFSLQYGDADVAAQLQAGLGEPLAPTSLRAFESGEDFAATPEPSASPEVDDAQDAQPEYPTLDELLSIGEETAEVVWPAEGAAGADVVAALSTESVALIASTSTAQGADGDAVAAHGDGVLVYDDAVSDALSAAALASDDHAEALVEASALLWFASSGDEPTLIALDRATFDDTGETGRTAQTLRDAIERVTRSAAVDTQSLTDLLAADTQPVDVVDIAPDAERTAAVSAFTAAEPDLARVATALDEPELLTGQARAEALQLLAVGWLSEPDAWREAVAAHAETTAQRVDGIEIRVSDQVQLLSAEAPLPVWVRNSLAWPITVVIESQPDSVVLEVRESIEVEVPAGSNPRVEIPVEARVGSGEVGLAVTLRTQGGEQIGDTRSMAVTVRAEWERVGVGVLVGIVVLLVIGGVIRTVLKRRRARQPHTGDDADGADDVDTGEKVASDE
ncbi:DUF6049 family protein [Microbacterium gilvum]|uniref:2-oxoglutarate dehydrogenase n=1 Tax=Microbacterium gilvum TaxID=1336204 RepID=A0ABP9A413_9MICO